MRWNDEQQRELDAAIARGEWQPPAINIEELRILFDKAPKVAASFKMWAD